MKFSLCNEVLAEFALERQCEIAAALGYDGLEVAHPGFKGKVLHLPIG